MWFFDCEKLLFTPNLPEKHGQQETQENSAHHLGEDDLTNHFANF